MYDYQHSSLVDFIMITNHFATIMRTTHSATNMYNSLLCYVLRSTIARSNINETNLQIPGTHMDCYVQC